MCVYASPPPPHTHTHTPQPQKQGESQVLRIPLLPSEMPQTMRIEYSLHQKLCAFSSVKSISFFKKKNQQAENFLNYNNDTLVK